jgi:hypothetical protein
MKKYKIAKKETNRKISAFTYSFSIMYTKLARDT